MISNYLTYHASLARRDDLARQTAEWAAPTKELAACPTPRRTRAAWVCQGRVNVAVAITPAWRCGRQPMRAVEIGDGGFTTWTTWLMGNAKERCLVSCIATERLTDPAGLQRPSGFGIWVEHYAQRPVRELLEWRAGPAFTANT